MRHPNYPVLAALAALCACGVRDLDDSGGSGTGTAASTGPGGASTGTTGTPTSGTIESATVSDTEPGGPGGDDPGDPSGCGFICKDDLPASDDCPGTHQLDPDCPEGHKCTLDGGLGDTHCVEIVPDPKGLYERCTASAVWLSGLDDCGLGMICWNVDEDGKGICVGLCDGTDSDCECADPKSSPSWCQECAVGVCLPSCDPLAQDCMNDGELCLPDPNGNGFSCILDASGDEGQVNDPCEFVNVCDEGLTCLNVGLASSACSQDATGCCQPFCEFPGAACPNPDQACMQWFDDPVPDGFEHIGVCAIAP